MAQLGVQQDFGTDVSSYPDLDPSFASISGNRVLIEICIRRWTTVRGSVPDSPNEGFDVRDYLNDSMIGLSGTSGNQTLSQMKQGMENEAKRDQRIKSCSVQLALDAAGNVTGTVTLDGGSGPFTLEIAITAVNLTLLKTG